VERRSGSTAKRLNRWLDLRQRGIRAEAALMHEPAVRKADAGVDERGLQIVRETLEMVVRVPSASRRSSIRWMSSITTSEVWQHRAHSSTSCVSSRVLARFGGPIP